MPLLEAWADLGQREVGADVGERQPILIDPQYRIDLVLARFFRRSRFCWLAEGSREAYAKGYRLFLTHAAPPEQQLAPPGWPAHAANPRHLKAEPAHADEPGTHRPP